MLIKHCGSRLFTLPLPSSSLLVMDFIHAANSIVSTPDLREVSGPELLLFMFHRKTDLLL